ncbi:MAG TPA: alpha/beta fold hydrolase, partial [Candidatus Nanopelagicales bacterium]|nr:alpha/beta fold hydrolase [Candidatus Nanopelagicales bacterium]
MKKVALLLAAAVLAAPVLAVSAVGSAPPATAATAPTVTDGCVSSVPDPGSTEPVRICYTLFRPAAATPRSRVPLIMHSHGWGGSRTTDPAAFSRWLDAGYGVLSFDQRGFGESGGHAYVENPDVEGHDVQALIALIGGLPWVQQDGPGDPHLGAIGGSYGGGYQFLAAFTSMQRTGKPILDALAPEITWHDLNQSLAPEGVVRDEWALALSAASLPSQALPPQVYKALVEGAATGTWPDGSVPGTEDMPTFFAKNGPAFHVSQGRRLPIPVLFGQGTTDTLFNLQQGFDNWQHALTARARRESIFVGYNGGHVLPTAETAVPPANSPKGDPCSRELAGGDFTALTRAFFDEKLRGRDRGL